MCTSPYAIDVVVHSVLTDIVLREEGVGVARRSSRDSWHGQLLPLALDLVINFTQQLEYLQVDLSTRYHFRSLRHPVVPQQSYHLQDILRDATQELVLLLPVGWY